MQVDKADVVSPVAEVVRRMLQRRHNDVTDFEITVPELLLKQEQRTKAIFNVVLGAIASISLVVGGIGIMNIMLASILERIKEIGVRRAMGATQKDVLWQFLSEAVMISLAGGVAGIIVGGGAELRHRAIRAHQHDRVADVGGRGVWRVGRGRTGVRHRAGPARGEAGSNRLSEVRVMKSPTHVALSPSTSLRVNSAKGSFSPRGKTHPFASLRATMLLLAVPVAVHAQVAVKPLTLQDAIAMAQSQGSSAQVARSSRDAARYRNDAFNARLRPQLFLTGDAANLNHGISPILQPDGSTLFVGQAQNQSTMSAGFQQAIPLTGGTVSIGSAVSRIDQFGTTNSRFYQTSPLIVSLTQDLFKPRNIVWNERVQSLAATVAERGYLEAREDVAGNTADAFFNLYAQQMQLANATANVSVNDTLYTLNKGRFEVGKIGENDLLKSELALLRARAAVEDARLARDRAEAALRRIIAYPESQPLSIVTPDAIPNVDANPDTAVAQALRNSSTSQQAELDDVIAKRGIVQARSNNRFNATIQASAGFNQTATAFGQSYQSPLGKQSLAVGVNLPMLQWGAGRADVASAKADEDQTIANNKIRRDALVEDARFSALQLGQAQRNILLAAKADTVAEKQFDVARNRYIIGKISNTDLYTAQDQKDQAILAYVQALRSYWTAYYHLRRVTLYDFVVRQPLSDADKR